VTEQSSAFDVIIPPGHERVYQSWHFAPAVRTGDTIYVSGVIGLGPDGTVPEDPGEEFSNAFAQLADTLAAAGASLADVVELTSFHVDMADTLRAFGAAKDAVISEPYPAWTAIGCTELAVPGGRAEVKATAVVRDPDRA
jgi:enamine deaminase RidA (YjgF/YER057c/UK114 family)